MCLLDVVTVTLSCFLSNDSGDSNDSPNRTGITSASLKDCYMATEMEGGRVEKKSAKILYKILYLERPPFLYSTTPKINN